MREGIGMTPFQLVNGEEAVVLVEIRIEFARISTYDEEKADKRLVELDLLIDTRQKAVARLRAYKQRMC